MKKILVTGGLGYIGSHTCIELLKANYEVVVVDNLSNSSLESIKRVEIITSRRILFYQEDIKNKSAIHRIFVENEIDAVIVGTSHAARNYPAVAIEIQNELQINGYAYDMLVGCSSTTFAINNAYSDIASGLAKTILVINTEVSTPFVNFTHRDKHFIFGDG